MLIDRHSSKVLALSIRMLGERAAAEDVSQETFMKLWEHASRWKPQGVAFQAWLYRVASNACLDRLRKRGREHPTHEAPEIEDDAPSAFDGIAAGDLRRTVEDAIAALPDRQRQAIALCHYQDFSNIEAAEIMETSVEALESLLARARRSLKVRLEPLRGELLEGVR